MDGPDVVPALEEVPGRMLERVAGDDLSSAAGGGGLDGALQDAVVEVVAAFQYVPIRWARGSAASE